MGPRGSPGPSFPALAAHDLELVGRQPSGRPCLMRTGRRPRPRSSPAVHYEVHPACCPVMSFATGLRGCAVHRTARQGRRSRTKPLRAPPDHGPAGQPHGLLEGQQASGLILVILPGARRRPPLAVSRRLRGQPPGGLHGRTHRGPCPRSAPVVAFGALSSAAMATSPHLGVSAVVPASSVSIKSAEQSPVREASLTGFIDVHAHFLTGSYVAQARAGGHDVPDGMPAWPD